MNYYIGNFHEDREKEPERKDWLVGQFMDGQRRTDKMSIKFWHFTKGPTGHKSKYQTIATECTIVTKGKLRAEIGSEKFEFAAGQYVVIPPMVPSNLAIEALEDSEGITIKAPSCDPDDTVKPAR